MGTQEDHDLLLRLEGKIDMALESLQQLSELNKRVNALEAGSATRNEQIGTLKSEIEKLRNTNTVWTAMNSIAIVIGTALGMRL